MHKLTTTDGQVWDYEKSGGEKNQMYVQEHKELIASIRAGTPVNMGEQLAHSSRLAIMGRMSAYTGRTIEWEDAINSNETWAPMNVDELKADSKIPTPEVAMPGRYKLPA